RSSRRYPASLRGRCPPSLPGTARWASAGRSEATEEEARGSALLRLRRELEGPRPRSPGEPQAVQEPLLAGLLLGRVPGDGEAADVVLEEKRHLVRVGIVEDLLVLASPVLRHRDPLSLSRAAARTGGGSRRRRRSRRRAPPARRTGISPPARPRR